MRPNSASGSFRIADNPQRGRRIQERNCCDRGQLPLLLLVAGLIVLLEQVLAEVTPEVAPYGVDVVGTVLRVV